MRLRTLIAAAGVALVVLTGCGNKSSAKDDTCAQVTTQKDELQQVAATIAALDIQVPHAHNLVKDDIQQLILAYCAEPGVEPGDKPYEPIVKRLEAQE